MTRIKMPALSVLVTQCSPCGLLTGESFIAKCRCDTSGAFVAEEILEVFKGLVLGLLMRVSHQLLWMLWTGVGPGMPVKALICIPQGVSWMLGLT